jgi:molybdate transport system substrate-binding protein
MLQSLLIMSALTGSLMAQEISVAAAADLQFALRDVASRFEKETGSKVQIVFGSSGNFFAQIQSGAPFDVFFSADVEYPKKLEEAGLGDPGSIYQYATGKIVLWTRRESGLDLKDGLKVVLDPRVKKVAIANPQHAPYGRAAVAALQHESLYEKVKDKLVFGENVSQAAQFADSGNAEVGIIALALAVAPAMRDRGKYVEVPTDFYLPLRQACVVLKGSLKKAAAQAFVDFLKKPEIVELMRSYGFSQP